MESESRVCDLWAYLLFFFWGLREMGLRGRLEAMQSHTVQRKRQCFRHQPQSQSGISSLFPKHEGLPILLENNFETEKNNLLVFSRPRSAALRRSPLPRKTWSSEVTSTRHDATRMPHTNGLLRIAQRGFHLFAGLREEKDLDRSVAAFAWQSHPSPAEPATEPAAAAAAAPPGANQDGHLVELHELTPSSPRQKSVPVWKEKLEQSNLLRNVRLKDLDVQIVLEKSLLEALRHTKETSFHSRIRDTSEDKEITTSVAFTPLSVEEEEEVHQALHGANRREVLAQHERSNIDLTREAMQCLKPGVWLNDEVINLYLELLKERELREPKFLMKCHFFNTFFFNKLYKDARSYDFKAVKRWTTQKKLGYNLLDCDKIFVPIHKDIHWCLAVINVREKKLQYLDSLKGHDGNVLQVLARYLKDEAKDKLNQNLDASTWDLDCPKDIPEQLNGCDCGMFMIKYADFYSRGDHLKFTQEHMEYFRKRTVLELLQLKAR